MVTSFNLGIFEITLIFKISCKIFHCIKLILVTFYLKKKIEHLPTLQQTSDG